MIFFVNAEFLDGPYNLSTVKIVELKRVWYLHILVTKAMMTFGRRTLVTPSALTEDSIFSC